MKIGGDAMAGYRQHPFGTAAFLAVLCAVPMLGMAADNAWRQAHDPDSFASSHCGGALGGGGPDVSDCYNATVVESPVQAAGWWLYAGGAAVIVVVGCAIGAARRRASGPSAGYGC